MNDFKSIAEKRYFDNAGKLPDDMSLRDRDCKLYYALLRRELNLSAKKSAELLIILLESFA